MKKFIIISLIAFLGLALNAQDVNKPRFDFDYNTFAVTKTYAVSDSVSSTRDSLAVNFGVINIGNPTYYNFKTHIYELTSPGRTQVRLQGRVFNNDSWTNITTATYTGVGTDTTIVFTSNTLASPNYYNQYRILYIRVNGKARLDYVRGVIKF